MEKYISGFDSNDLTSLILDGDSPDDNAWAKEHGYIFPEVEEAWDGRCRIQTKALQTVRTGRMA